MRGMLLQIVLLFIVFRLHSPRPTFGQDTNASDAMDVRAIAEAIKNNPVLHR